MKKILIPIVLAILSLPVFSQKTMMVEKIGSSRRYFYHAGDYIKLRVTKKDTILAGKLWSVGDSVISVSELRPFDVHIHEIGSVYKRFSFPKKFGRVLLKGGAAIFVIIGINHLINNERLFTPDMFIIAGSMAGAGLISISLDQKRCRTDRGWRIKIMDYPIR